MEERSIFQIDQILYKCRASSKKVGGGGIRYTVMIRGKESFLFHEGDKWFVRSKGEQLMILSHKEIEEIAAAVTEDFNEFFFGSQVEEVQAPRATPIDQLAKDYLGLTVSFAKLSKDGSICGLTAYADTEYAVEEGGAIRKLALRQNQVLLDESFIQPGQVRALCGKRRFTLAHECAHQILYQMESDDDNKACRKKYAAGQPHSLRDLKTP